MRSDVSAGKGNNRTRQGRKDELEVGSIEKGSLPGDVARSGRNLDARSFWDTFMWFFSRHDGWLRIVADSDAEVLYIKWKFSSGAWKGYYCMARVDVWELDVGLYLLRDKVERVDLGVHRPTKDQFYDAS